MTTVLESLNTAIHTAMQSDQRVYLLGEDLLDPYGGAFKVARNLSSAFPDRVLTTPVSEAGIVGFAAGMALRGLRPIVEIMFGDFLTLAADQIINSIAKFPWMYNDQVEVPLLIRTPMGGGRGYGPTHSQSLEKHFLGVPGLTVLAPTTLDDPGELLSRAILAGARPTLFIENKLQYNLPLFDPEDNPDFVLSMSAPSSPSPAYTLSISGAPSPAITIAAYGYMADVAAQAVHHLAYRHEIFAELVVPTQLSPFDLPPLFDSLGRTHRLITVEEGTHMLGWGAEVLAQAAVALGPDLHASARFAAADHPIPASIPLEQAALPTRQDIIAAVKRMV